jgi:hypothetical protein
LAKERLVEQGRHDVLSLDKQPDPHPPLATALSTLSHQIGCAEHVDRHKDAERRQVEREAERAGLRLEGGKRERRQRRAEQEQDGSEDRGNNECREQGVPERLQRRVTNQRSSAMSREGYCAELPPSPADVADEAPRQRRRPQRSSTYLEPLATRAGLAGDDLLLRLLAAGG